VYKKKVEQIVWDNVLSKLKEVFGKDYKETYVRQVIRGYVKNRTIEPVLIEMELMEKKQ
jgi:hypothetical protein